MAEDEVVVVETVIEVVEVAAVGPQGPQGIPGDQGDVGSDLHYVHTQGVASSTWIVNHNLDKYPAVSILILGIEVEADVSHNSLNQLTVSWPSPQTGEVTCN